MPEPTDLLTTNRKALTLNLDPLVYGTFAEIGAGQEVARLFFQAGAASGTIAKTISAYDMTFSDAIYGKAPRYVSRERLKLMLHHEYELLIERLAEKRGENTAFFAFADTVAARNYHGTNECHGWMGLRFQNTPGASPSEVTLHVRMKDRDALLQHQALGVVGVNLMFAALHLREASAAFVASLLDNVGTGRIEVDMIHFDGPAFAGVDNRLMALELVRQKLTHAVMFDEAGLVRQPAELCFRKAVLVQRGSFRPVTHVNVDMLERARAQFEAREDVKGKPLLAVMEITLRNLLSTGELDSADFLSRVDLLAELGCCAMISDYPEYYRLSSYFRRHTQEPVGIALGINTLVELFNERHYEHLEGGVLESMGKLFRSGVRLYVYPILASAHGRHLAGEPMTGALPTAVCGQEVLVTACNVQVSPPMRQLYAHLFENGFIEPVLGADPARLHIFSAEVLRQIKAREDGWEDMVPPSVANAIKRHGLFGYETQAA